MDKKSKIYIAGHRGMVGSAILRKLEKEGYNNLLLKTSSELDLRVQQQVEALFSSEQPEFVFLAAAKVGGILANDTYRADFIYDNIIIESNIIHAAWKYGVKKLLFMGSSCIYPKMAPQPLKEEYLLTGLLEPTNEPYAIAKIAGIKMCDAYRAQYGCNFISAMPTNLYGPNDHYDLHNSHVLPALIRKFHEAVVNEEKEVVLWGSGKPRREFLYSDDLADACLFLMEHFNEPGFINVGMGKDLEIRELAKMIKEISRFAGEIRNDLSKPDGTPQKLLDISKISKMGWAPTTSLETGIRKVYQDYARTAGLANTMKAI